MNRPIVAALLILGCLAFSTAGAEPQHLDADGVVVLNFTRFVPVAREVVIPAGETARYNLRSGNFGRVSLLVAGGTRPDAGHIGLRTLFGPPLVPAAGPRPLPVNENGRIAAAFVEPVLGPAMTIVIHNDSSSDARLTISAYLAN
jgi:hypothetical protein